MLLYIPRAEQEQFHELGDGYVYMHLYTMEKYLFPTLHVMRFLDENTRKRLPGGVESMIAYSFFNQGMRLPRNRTEYDLDVLRNSVFSAGRDIPQQLQSSAEVNEGISSHFRSTFRRLREATTLPDLNQLDGYDQTKLDERQAETDALIKIYSNQVSADYATCRLEKEKLIMLSHTFRSNKAWKCLKSISGLPKLWRQTRHS